MRVTALSHLQDAMPLGKLMTGRQIYNEVCRRRVYVEDHLMAVLRKNIENGLFECIPTSTGNYYRRVSDSCKAQAAANEEKRHTGRLVTLKKTKIIPKGKYTTPFAPPGPLSQTLWPYRHYL